MSHGRSGKVSAALHQQQQQHKQPHALHKPIIPPLQFKPAAPLWRETDEAAAAAAASSNDPTSSLPTATDPRTWTWDAILASSQQHGTASHPYRSSGTNPTKY